MKTIDLSNVTAATLQHLRDAFGVRTITGRNEYAWQHKYDRRDAALQSGRYAGQIKANARRRKRS